VEALSSSDFVFASARHGAMVDWTELVILLVMFLLGYFLCKPAVLHSVIGSMTLLIFVLRCFLC
jgi:hypothetical protein